MNWGFGPDFLAARKGDTYHANNGQWWLWVVLFVLVQFVVLSTLQAVFGTIVHGVLFGAMPDFGSVEGEGAARFAKSTIVGLLPSTLLTALFSWWLAGKLNPTGMRGLPLHVPALGAGGWALIIGGFLAVMWVIFLSHVRGTGHRS